MTDLIAEYSRHLREIGRAESTISTYIDDLRRIQRKLPVPLDRACTDELREAILDPANKPGTWKLRRAVAVAFFDWACDPDDPRLDFNPARLIKPVRAPQRIRIPPGDDTLTRVLAAASRPCLDWFVIAAHTGARCIEIAALDRDDITERQTLLRGKGSKDRLVPTHPAVWALAQRLPPGPVAREPDGRRLTRRQVSMRGNHQLRRLGYGGSMHDLRRWYGNRTADVVDDVRVVQQLLGHASLATTRLYMGLAGPGMAAAVAGLPAVL